jgi:hypothetical protein
MIIGSGQNEISFYRGKDSMMSLFKWGRHDDVHLSKGTANEIPSKALLIFKILNVSLYDFSFAENFRMAVDGDRLIARHHRSPPGNTGTDPLRGRCS